jgi:hypothetical protein
MRNFGMVSPLVWHSKRMNGVSDQGKLLFAYLLTSPHSNSAGVYKLREGYVCADLAWEPEAYQRAKKELVNAGMIQAEDTTEEVSIGLWFKHCPPKTGAHYLNAETQILSISSQRLRDAALDALKPTWNQDWKGPKRLENGQTVAGERGANGLVTTLRTRLNT